MDCAWYDAQLARAMPGTTQEERDWQISLVRGHAAIHAAGVLHGECYIWPQPERSEIGRELMALSSWVRELKETGVECDL